MRGITLAKPLHLPLTLHHTPLSTRSLSLILTVVLARATPYLDMWLNWNQGLQLRSTIQSYLFMEDIIYSLDIHYSLFIWSSYNLKQLQHSFKAQLDKSMYLYFYVALPEELSSFCTSGSTRTQGCARLCHHQEYTAGGFLFLFLSPPEFGPCYSAVIFLWIISHI